MAFSPYFALDLRPAGLLPAGWEKALEALARGPDLVRLTTFPPAEPHADPATFSILSGEHLRDSLHWLWLLYHSRLREFAGTSFGFPLFASNRLDATTTLNVFGGRGAGYDWHRDANPVSGVLFASSLAEGEGGELQFRGPDGQFCQIRPEAGLFVCFAGNSEHQIAPLRVARQRLSVAMTYYTSGEDQLFANENNRYTL